MAEGLARALWGDRAIVQSAGPEPSQVNPAALQVMAEIGMSLEGHRAKSAESIDPDTVSVVITLCAEEVCPAFLGNARRFDWPFPDPAAPVEGEDEADRLLRFRKVRDAIREKLQSTRIEALLGADCG